MLKIKFISFVAALLTTMTAWAQELTPLTGNCGATGNETNVTWTLSDENSDGTYDKLAITGTGAMMDFYSFDDETMGIENVTIIGRSQSQKQVAQPEIIDGNIYDLQGRRVAQAKKGLYVVNGKKVVIK